MRTHKRRLRITVAAIAAVVTIVVIAAGYTIWFAYHSAHLADASLKSANKVSSGIPKVPPITTFAACEKAPKSTILQTYPEQCVTVSGKKFTNTAQPKYLVIKEWGVELPYSSSDTFTYRIQSPASNTVTVISAQLAKTYGCTDYGAGTITRDRASSRVHPDDPADTQTIAQIYPTDPEAYVKLGTYYYSFVHDQAECGTAPVKAQNTANTTLQSALPGIRSSN